MGYAAENTASLFKFSLFFSYKHSLPLPLLLLLPFHLQHLDLDIN